MQPWASKHYVWYVKPWASWAAYFYSYGLLLTPPKWLKNGKIEKIHDFGKMQPLKNVQNETKTKIWCTFSMQICTQICLLKFGPIFIKMINIHQSSSFLYINIEKYFSSSFTLLQKYILNLSLFTLKEFLEFLNFVNRHPFQMYHQSECQAIFKRHSDIKWQFEYMYSWQFMTCLY